MNTHPHAVRKTVPPEKNHKCKSPKELLWAMTILIMRENDSRLALCM